MQVEQTLWSEINDGAPSTGKGLNGGADLVFIFGSRRTLARKGCMDQVRAAYPDAHLIGCSTAGEIHGTRVHDDTLVVTAVAFQSTVVRGAMVRISENNGSRQAGEKLAAQLRGDQLKHVFVLSDGIHVNGTGLVSGLTDGLPKDVVVTGGLSGDGDRFEETSVIWDGEPEPGTVAAVGLYGEQIKVGCGSLGGWDPFGPERLITRSQGNVLYELDGHSALGLYKQYLGAHADGLPATGLLFPLSLRSHSSEEPVVRTILAVDETEHSLTFAGDIPQGAYARLMKANFNRLIDGAAGAARTSNAALGSSAPDLAILISCVGRKLVLKQRVEEEVEAVRDVLGGGAALAGFYSYGEISPFTHEAKCELHNQTMTITTLTEG